MPALRVASSWCAREDPRNGACRTRQLRKECVGSHQQAEAGEEPTLSWEWNPRAAPGQGQAVRRAGPGRRRPSTERHPGFQTRAPAQATGVVAELGRAQGHIPETTPTTAVRFRRHDEAGDRLRRAMMGDATTLAEVAFQRWPSRLFLRPGLSSSALSKALGRFLLQWTLRSASPSLPLRTLSAHIGQLDVLDLIRYLCLKTLSRQCQDPGSPSAPLLCAESTSRGHRSAEELAMLSGTAWHTPGCVHASCRRRGLPRILAVSDHAPREVPVD